jgi:hypothetical protein
MQSFTARIERTNRQALDHVEVRLNLEESPPSRATWRGEFLARSADGILPSEALRLTLDNGQQGTARVRETHFDSRTPEATLIQFVGTGPLV